MEQLVEISSKMKTSRLEYIIMLLDLATYYSFEQFFYSFYLLFLFLFNRPLPKIANYIITREYSFNSEDVSSARIRTL